MNPIHIVSNKKDIAKDVLMPGDPLRAKYIAEKYLDNVIEVNNVRNMLGFTGTYKGKKVTVMGSGMGIPSMGIYAYELYNFYDVENIIRIGSSGAFSPEVKVRDIVLGENAFSHSNFSLSIKKKHEKLIGASDKLNNKILDAGKRLNIPLHYGTIYTSEVFDVYHNIDHLTNNIKEADPLISEMEAFALFHIADLVNKNAACLATVSDSPFERDKDFTPEEREQSLDDMILVALESL